MTHIRPMELEKHVNGTPRAPDHLSSPEEQRVTIRGFPPTMFSLQIRKMS
jgi:hypothetical protein